MEQKYNYKTKEGKKNLKNLIIKEVKNNPQNLQEAFRKVASKTGYNASTVSNMWYGQHPYRDFQVRSKSYCFSVVGPKSSVNRKNIHNGCNHKLFTTEVHRIKEAFATLKKFFKRWFSVKK